MKLRNVVASITLLLLLPSCLGPNNLFDSVREFNVEVSENDVVREVLFLGLLVIPVYKLALLGDFLIFNTIEYWSGSNPITRPAPFPDDFHYDTGTPLD